MGQKNIEKLEELVSALVEEVRSLRAKNDLLVAENARLAKEFDAASVDIKKNQVKLERLALLERTCKKMETGNISARLKIQNILAELERADWS